MLKLSSPTTLRKPNTTTVPTASPLPPTQPISGKISPSINYLSTVGAFNGTGIAIGSQSIDGGASNSEADSTEFNNDLSYGDLVMYFQYYTGQIREMQLSENEWVGGNSSDFIEEARDAKNGTSITTVSYVFDNTVAVSIKRPWKLLHTKPVIVAYILHLR